LTYHNGTYRYTFVFTGKENEKRKDHVNIRQKPSANKRLIIAKIKIRVSKLGIIKMTEEVQPSFIALL
jgi:hypothetical protein